MKSSSPLFPTTRREFLRLGTRGIGLLAFSRFAPSFVVESVAAETPRAEKDRSILVLVQLAGGNDGLNTVIPHADPRYYKLRPTLALPRTQLLDLNDTVALNAACAPLHQLFGEGKVGIVQNVGYPNPNRSHFRSTEIWETASASDQFLSSGWLGRYFDNTCAGAPTGGPGEPRGINLGTELPQSFTSEKAPPTFSLSSNRRFAKSSRDHLKLLEALAQEHQPDEHDNAGYLRHTLMDSLVTERRFQKILAEYRPGAAYPTSAFARSLQNIAGLIAGGVSTRVYYTSLGGFDTHANQLITQNNLLRQLSEGLVAFQRDLESKGLDQQVITMTFSEFGRRPVENESKGTDHGTAAPLFVVGSGVKGGVHGKAPGLDLDRGEDLAFSTDFRAVYATVLDRWLGCDAQAVLGSQHAALNFL